jgi:hypothetical protein
LNWRRPPRAGPAPVQDQRRLCLGAVPPPAKHAPAVPAMLDAEGGAGRGLTPLPGVDGGGRPQEWEGERSDRYPFVLSPSKGASTPQRHPLEHLLPTTSQKPPDLFMTSANVRLPTARPSCTETGWNPCSKILRRSSAASSSGMLFPSRAAPLLR